MAKYSLGNVLLMLGIVPMFMITSVLSLAFALAVLVITAPLAFYLIHLGIVEGFGAIDWQSMIDYVNGRD